MPPHTGAHEFEGREIVVGDEVRQFCRLCERPVFVRRATDADKK